MGTFELDPARQRPPLSPTPVLGLSALPAVPTVGAEFKDAALGERCGGRRARLDGVRD